MTLYKDITNWVSKNPSIVAVLMSIPMGIIVMVYFVLAGKYNDNKDYLKSYALEQVGILLSVVVFLVVVHYVPVGYALGLMLAFYAFYQFIFFKYIRQRM